MKKFLKNNMAGMYNLSLLVLLFTYPISNFTSNSTNDGETYHAENSGTEITKSAFVNNLKLINRERFTINPIFGTNDAIKYKELHYKKMNVIIPFLNH